MQCVPLPDDEVERRKALFVALWAQKAFPPLYRVASMDPERLLTGSFGASSPLRTHSVFADADVASRPRLEVHTLEQGAVDAGAPVLWGANFGHAIPASSTPAASVPVTVSGALRSGSLVAAVAGGWMVAVDAPDATLLVSGPGEVPDPLTLERVDPEALQRSAFRNSGIDAVSD